MGFSADWLALREPADHAARDPSLLSAAADAAGLKPVIVDLGCGTGSTIRAFAGHLAAPASWRLVDNDPELLTIAADAAGQRVTTHRIDLRDLDSLPLEGASLVTASALLDLCSRNWVARLAERLSAYGLPFYAALNYDGMMRWSPADTHDAAVTLAFNRHQRGDKGFGPALGPDAAAVIAEVFGAAGYDIVEADSPWRLTKNHAALQRELLQGIAQAAHEAGESAAKTWGAARTSAADTAICHIGHRDLLALPKGTA
ncbi:MAG: class I SAM-dependent methyltransferase [Paracoccaceae bacterium]|nr:class I SAM-dependent methyltransferase [Paracoccaceae bacterium]